MLLRNAILMTDIVKKVIRTEKKRWKPFRRLCSHKLSIHDPLGMARSRPSFHTATHQAPTNPPKNCNPASNNDINSNINE